MTTIIYHVYTGISTDTCKLLVHTIYKVNVKVLSTVAKANQFF